jgi:hypothetical protein
MNDNVKAKITAKLDGLTDDQGRQVLDYVEFLDSKYNRSRRAPSAVQRLTEGIEDRLGSVRIADVAQRGTAQVVDAASRVIAGIAAAGKVVAGEVATKPATAPEPATETPGKDEPPAPPAGGAAR